MLPVNSNTSSCLKESHYHILGNNSYFFFFFFAGNEKSTQAAIIASLVNYQAAKWQKKKKKNGKGCQRSYLAELIGLFIALKRQSKIWPDYSAQLWRFVGRSASRVR